MILVKIIVFVIVLSVIILIHELGHFIFAKKAGVLCHEFSLGMGPVLYQKKKGETTYSLRAIPIGGFVSMAGEQITEDTVKVDDEIGLNIKDGKVYEIVLSEKKNADIRGKVIKRELYGKHGEPLEIELEFENEYGIKDTKVFPVIDNAFYVFDNQTLQIAPYNRCFESKSLWNRFLSIVFGPVMNFILAIFIYLVCAFVQGTPNYNSNIIGAVASDYPSSEILKANDEIISVNGYEISNWNEFSKKMDELAYDGVSEINLVVKRNGEITTLEPINNWIVINSIGLSNQQVDESVLIPEDVKGVRVGNLALRYKNEVSENTTQISNGDVITKICALPYGESYSEDLWMEVSSWSDIVLKLRDLDVAYIYFEYYDTKTNEIKNTYVDNQAVETYGNEVLNNQRIEKIQIYIGVNPEYHRSFIPCIKEAFGNFWSDFTLIFRTLKLLINPSGVRQVGVNNLSGVVGIYSMIGQYLNAGILALLLFMAMLSVNIGVMNLLPIPALDGGRIVFLLIEGITRKPINRKVETIVNNVMFILLMLLMVYVTWNDITRLFK